MLFENLLIETKDQIQYIIINRESKLNALNHSTIAELQKALEAALQNPEVSGIIITGVGKKAFVAGADISEFENINISNAREIALFGHSVFNNIENANKPVIAAINGFALGGGLELAMACHIRIVADTAKLGLPEVSLGLIPGYGGTQRLTQLVGKGKAMEMIMTADMITAAEAYQFGLVNHVELQENVLTKAAEILNKIRSRAPLAVAAAINSVNANDKTVNGFESEVENFSQCFGTNEIKEGISAFIEKRKPIFKRD